MSAVLRVPLGERVTFSCAWCGEAGEIVVDPSGGRSQRLVEDCWVCCRPNLLELAIADDGEPRLRVARES